MAGPPAGGSNKRRPNRQRDDGRPFGVRGNEKNSHGLIAPGEVTFALHLKSISLKRREQWKTEQGTHVAA